MTRKSPLCVGSVRDSPLFSLAPALPSKTSSGRPGLPSFGSFIGTIFGVWGGFRLLRSVHIQLRLLAFLDRTAQGSQNGGLWSWEIGFSCIWFPPVLKQGVLGSLTTWDPARPRVYRPIQVVPSPSGNRVSIPNKFFGALSPSPSFPLFTLRQLPHDSQRKTRGQNGFAIPFL